ncbi:hypothetical protein AB8U03_17365 [Clostridium sp. Mt-5]|uniref:Phage protein n=1 Tax=Clostridium moutaii TaxID=3240932 RepID=A0ABV4BTT3_9CLOT
MRELPEALKNFRSELAINKINLFDIMDEDIKVPEYPEGEVKLKIIEFNSTKMYGEYEGVIRIEFIFEDEEKNKFRQLFLLKNGKNDNLAKFVCDALGYQPEGEFELKSLEGKEIIAVLHHYYTQRGIGYCNIAFCDPVNRE